MHYPTALVAALLAIAASATAQYGNQHLYARDRDLYARSAAADAYAAAYDDAAGLFDAGLHERDLDMYERNNGLYARDFDLSERDFDLSERYPVDPAGQPGQTDPADVKTVAGTACKVCKDACRLKVVPTFQNKCYQDRCVTKWGCAATVVFQ